MGGDVNGAGRHPRASGAGGGAALLGRFGWYRRLQAWLLARTTEAYEREVEPRKRALLGGLRGRIVEVGPGIGANLRYYASDVAWIGVEPNPFMERGLRREAARMGIDVEVRRGVAEALPLPDHFADAVVMTLVLCSVRDPRAALREVRRVLRPGGRFVFVEHVAAPRGSGLRRLQRWIRPLWRIAADGCEPDRETAGAIEAAGFSRVEIARFRVAAPVVAPHIAGEAVEGVAPPRDG